MMNPSPRETSEESCPNCGMSRKDWPDPKGFDNTYCCEACSKGEVCTCPNPMHSPEEPHRSARQ